MRLTVTELIRRQFWIHHVRQFGIIWTGASMTVDGGNFVFDIEAWAHRCGCSPEISRLPIRDQIVSAELICSPCSLVLIEELRERLGAYSTDVPLVSVPTDVFVMGRGEPSSRFATKIGGMPAMPKTRPWPRTGLSREMTFLAQFDFSASKEIVKVPGDVLLIFTSTPDICEGEPVLAFEWANGSELLDLYDCAMVPKPAWPFVTCYGVRHRSCDFPSPGDFHSLVKKAIGTFGCSDVPLQIENVRVFEAVKIGGVPFWIEEDEQSRRMAEHDFICSLCSILPPSQEPFPWINREAPLSIEESFREQERLEFRAGAIVNFFLTASEAIEWTVQFW